MKKIEKESSFAEGLIVFLFVYIFIGIMFGGVTTVDNRMNDRDGCRYKSYASYINPGYGAMCELFRVRFEKPETDYYDSKK